MTEHTPTPWALMGRGDIIGICKGFPQKPVAKVLGQETSGERAANIDLMLKAVNSHDALVARVKYLEATEANEILRLKTALKECAMRCRYDGDLFHDQGNIQRRDASWKAQEDAEAILASVSTPSGSGK